MKTTKIISVLILAAVFAGTTSGFSSKIETLGNKNTQNTGITYDVIIHRDFVNTPCNTYIVQVVDETGRLVAPAQFLAPGIDKYTFIEKLSGRGQTISRRSAMLVEVNIPDQFVCPYPLFALPDVKTGPFYIGQTYFFNLYPHTQLFKN